MTNVTAAVSAIYTVLVRLSGPDGSRTRVQK